MKTMGRKMTRLSEPIDGCAAETASGTVILLASLIGAPISTTQVATGSIAGTAMAYRIGNVRWSVMVNILLAWVFTFPGAAFFGVLVLLFMRLFTG